VNKYWILWTYIGNYSDRPYVVQAETPQKAAESILEIYSDDFKAKGKVYVFDKEPVLVSAPGDR
jgi:hypothetical protein